MDILHLTPESHKRVETINSETFTESMLLLSKEQDILAEYKRQLERYESLGQHKTLGKYTSSEWDAYFHAADHIDSLRIQIKTSEINIKYYEDLCEIEQAMSNPLRDMSPHHVHAKDNNMFPKRVLNRKNQYHFELWMNQQNNQQITKFTIEIQKILNLYIQIDNIYSTIGKTLPIYRSWYEPSNQDIASLNISYEKFAARLKERISQIWQHLQTEISAKNTFDRQVVRTIKDLHDKKNHGRVVQRIASRVDEAGEPAVQITLKQPKKTQKVQTVRPNKRIPQIIKKTHPEITEKMQSTRNSYINTQNNMDTKSQHPRFQMNWRFPKKNIWSTIFEMQHPQSKTLVQRPTIQAQQKFYSQQIYQHTQEHAFFTSKITEGPIIETQFTTQKGWYQNSMELLRHIQQVFNKVFTHVQITDQINYDNLSVDDLYDKACQVFYKSIFNKTGHLSPGDLKHTQRLVFVYETVLLFDDILQQGIEFHQRFEQVNSQLQNIYQQRGDTSQDFMDFLETLKPDQLLSCIEPIMVELSAKGNINKAFTFTDLINRLNDIFTTQGNKITGHCKIIKEFLKD